MSEPGDTFTSDFMSRPWSTPSVTLHNAPEPVSRAVGLESLLCALALVAWLTAPAVVWIVWRAAWS
jgi:hypothetical protein